MDLPYLRFRWCRALVLGVLSGCVVLAACRPASTAPIVAAPTPTTVLAPSTLSIPTATLATVATSATLTSSATALPTATRAPSVLPDAISTASVPSQSRGTSPSFARLSPS